MQNLARDGLTPSRVTALLSAPSIEVDAGLELLDSSDAVVSDLSADFLGGEVEHHNYADIHGTFRFSLSRALTWATARVRPFLIITDASTKISTRWNLGVYMLKTPERALGEDLLTYDVAGVDKVSLLTHPVGDTYVVTAGTTYVAAVTAAIAAAGGGTRVNIGGPSASTPVPVDMVWALTESDQTTWLRVVNDLLASIGGYTSVWVDQDGYFRSGPYASPTTRGAEWTLSSDDPRTSLVSENRTERVDGFEAVNSWRFIQRNGAAAPLMGAGIHTYTNTSSGPYSVNALGRIIRKVLYLDAADHASLVLQGDAVIQADTQVVTTIEVDTAPLPQAGHFDVLTFTDADLGGSFKTQARSWSLPLDGSDMRWTLEVISP